MRQAGSSNSNAYIIHKPCRWVLLKRYRLIIASKNKNKLRELELAANILLPEINIEIDMQEKYEKIEIQSSELSEIALKALQCILSRYNPQVGENDILLVEDSGLFIDVLKGFPGPYSSYILKTIGIDGVLKLLEDKDNRRASYKASMAFYNPRYGTGVVEGVLKGEISREARGSEGFGFDPIFIPEGYRNTLSELGLHVKIRISHRSRALVNLFRKLIEF